MEREGRERKGRKRKGREMRLEQTQRDANEVADKDVDADVGVDEGENGDRYRRYCP